MDPSRGRKLFTAQDHKGLEFMASLCCLLLQYAYTSSLYPQRRWKDSGQARTQAASYLTCWIKHFILPRMPLCLPSSTCSWRYGCLGQTHVSAFILDMAHGVGLGSASEGQTPHKATVSQDQANPYAGPSPRSGFVGIWRVSVGSAGSFKASTPGPSNYFLILCFLYSNADFPGKHDKEAGRQSVGSSYKFQERGPICRALNLNCNQKSFLLLLFVYMWLFKKRM